MNECKLEGNLKLIELSESANYAIFTSIRTYKTHGLTDHHPAIGNFFLPAIGRKSIDLTNLKGTLILPAGWQQRLFLSAPSPACFIGLILLRSLLFDFPCANLDTPIALGRLVLNVLCVGRVVRPPGTAAIYRSGQTNIGSHWAVCGPLPLP